MGSCQSKVPNDIIALKVSVFSNQQTHVYVILFLKKLIEILVKMSIAHGNLKLQHDLNNSLVIFSR